MEDIETFLIELVKSYYSQGDDYFAYKSKKGMWHFGYSNDYPMQHGNGQSFHLPEKIVEILICKN